MEEEILQEMIRDRETQIKMIKRKMEEQSRKLERVTKDLAETKATYQTQHVDQTMSLEKLHTRHSKLLHQYKESKENLDMKKQPQQAGGAQLHIYNEVMKNVATPESMDSSYVLRMQAQLCKAMHNMGMMETQLAMSEAQKDEKTKHLKDAVTSMVEEKSQCEFRLMNDMVDAGNALREVETKHKDMISTFTKEKDELVEKIEKQQEAAAEEEEGASAEQEEDDEEEKEELKEILTQGREEIQRLEQENKQELENLEELKARVAAIRGEPFVEELLASIADEFKDRFEEEEDW